MLNDVQELRTFHRILETGSLSAAARDLGTSLAVVSKRLAALEKRTGARLVHRTTRSLSATQEGERLFIDVERVLEAVKIAEERLCAGRDEPMGTLRVSAPVEFGRRHIAPLLGEMAERWPYLSVSLVLEDRLANLVSEGLDASVRIGEVAESSAIMRRVAENRRILVASPAYLDQHGRPPTPEEAERHVFLKYGDPRAVWRLEGPDGATAQLAATSRLRAADGDAVRDWALAGRGITLKSEIDVADDLSQGKLERVLPDWTGGAAPIFVLFPSTKHLPKKTRAFIDAVVQHFA